MFVALQDDSSRSHYTYKNDLRIKITATQIKTIIDVCITVNAFLTHYNTT